ncbi:MAG: KpsF/GutQ family sugar-phosphate isomerase [Opitutia bacterium]|nr:KpsF/GutQ family sugar-phosphate isomerase [Opitutales bacterium]PHX69160.1 MAG: KpsF/GutQ family sugar-phosphate isomerase [Opitutae bacterium]
MTTPLQSAQSLLKAEAEALTELSQRLDGSFTKVVDLIAKHSGKVVLIGVGKSGLIAQKIASTLCSTGTPAIFLHAADAVHGDLGILQSGDPVILISRSGATAELVRLLPVLRSFKSPLIALVGNTQSPLATQADFVLDIGARPEADPLGLVPTTSTLLTLALGDALAAALITHRGFGASDFARFHPAGQLGRNLSLTVGEVFQSIDRCAQVDISASLREAVIAMTTFPNGAACILNAEGILMGLITDGDLRRVLSRGIDLNTAKVIDVMTKNPIRTHPQVSLVEAARVMEDRPSQISVLPVTHPDNQKCLGLLRIHDIYQAGLV